MPLFALSSLLMILTIHIVLKKTLSVRVNKRATISTASVLCITYALSVIILAETTVRVVIDVVGLLFAMISPLVIFRGIKKSQSLFIVTLLQGLILSILSSTEWIIHLIFKTTIDYKITDFFTHFVFFLVCMLATKHGFLTQIIRRITLSPRHMKMIIILSIWISALLLSLLSFFFSTYSDLLGFDLIQALIFALIILTGIMCPLLLINNRTSTFYKRLSDIMNNQVRAQVAHYEAMMKMNENIRVFKHDYMNLRNGLISLLNQNDLAGALALLNTDKMKLTEVIYSFTTGSAILDALLSEKQISADKVNTSIEYDGIVPWKSLDPSDICVIFGNAIDNAIEACAKFTDENKKMITVRAKYSNSFLFINIENPTTQDVLIINNDIETTKNDKQTHGMGLMSIRAAVERYSGQLTLTCKSGVFSLGIDLDFNR